MHSYRYAHSKLILEYVKIQKSNKNYDNIYFQINAPKKPKKKTQKYYICILIRFFVCVFKFALNSK